MRTKLLGSTSDFLPWFYRFRHQASTTQSSQSGDVMPVVASWGLEKQGMWQCNGHGGGEGME